MYYAVGDIHGELEKLKIVYSKILKDIKSKKDEVNTIVFLGDYCDRGPDSKGVYDFLMNLKNTTKLQHVFLVGNHEIFFAGRNNFATQRIWFSNGGLETVDSFYPGKTKDEISKLWNSGDFEKQAQKYHNWIATLLMIYDTPHYVFAHGMIDPLLPLNEQNPDTVLWGRPRKEDYYANYNKVVIHGHTPHDEIQYRKNCIMVDTWCGHNPAFKLSVVCLPNIFTDMSEVYSLDSTLLE